LFVQRTVLVLAVVVAVLFSLAASRPQAAPAKATASCGVTITTDTVLRTDLRGCAGTAVTIGGDGVALDLGGHVVEGAIVANGNKHVSIRNGSVAGDVRLERVEGASVRRLRVRGGSIQCVRTTGCVIVRNRVASGGIAIAQATPGFTNRVRANVVHDAPGAGIAADRLDSASIIFNVVRGSAVGIETSHAADISIAHNVLEHNSGDGLSGSFGSAAVIARNLIAANGGDGISLRTWGGLTTIARNLVLRNRGHGIFGFAVAHWRVLRNLASRNGASGITITGAVEDATLTGNHVRANHGLGIDASPEVVDGGGNRVSGEGAGGKCAGVHCA
jgi:hypothetical protein